jgi:hypothetical protein
LRISAPTTAFVLALCCTTMLAQEPAPPKGQVLFQSHGEAPDPKPEDQSTPAAEADKPTGPALTDDERSAIRFTAYDLDVRLSPATGKLTTRARLTLRNDGAAPLTRIALQISSTLQWESATTNGAKLTLSQQLLDTDADHTGRANEAVIDLSQPLAPQATLTLDTFYSGTIPASSARLEHIGATESQALDSDWDAITPTSTALRGFGNVLWYPVASPQLFLGEGAQLFQAIGAIKLREQSATIHLRLAVEYAGDPPAAAYFCGRRKAFTALADNDSAVIGNVTGIATADFPAEPLGFRTPSLFLVNQPERLTAPLPTFDETAVVATPTTAKPAFDAPQSSSSISSSSGAPVGETPETSMLAVDTTDDGAAAAALAASAENIAPVLQDWLGPQPLSMLTVIDHRGQPFEDGPLLVGPAAVLGTSDTSPALAHSLTHAWIQTGRPWMDEGLAQFFALIWTEHAQGRETAIAQFDDLLQPLAIAEPNITNDASTTADQGQPLITASSELYYRRKAAAVWFMLRNIVGDEALGEALRTWRQRTPTNTTAEEDALAFEKLIEHSGKQNAKNPINLHWFFNDWVLRDRGLPDLSITDVTPRSLPMGQGHPAGYLVSVSVKNDGAAEVQVPVTIRSASYSTTSQLRVAGFASATARVIVEAPPAEVLVNDGTTPEIRTPFHKITVGSIKTR